MQCPKCKHPTLNSQQLQDKLAVKECSQCEGIWIPSDDYETWQGTQPDFSGNFIDFAANPNINFTPSNYDAKAALCPECGRYLSRAKITINQPFYVERCPQCNGIWCDQGEWNILTKLSLNTCLEYLFSSEWQMKLREQQQAYQERQALIEKMGSSLAKQIIDLGETLKNHPDGDFGVAYLMRQISDSDQIKNKD